MENGGLMGMRLGICLALFAWTNVSFAQSDGWVEIGNDNGITVYRKDLPGSDVVSFRGETVIAAKAEDVFSILADNDLAPKWIPLVAGKKVLKQLSETRRLEYTHIAMPWPLTDRYFVNNAEVTYLPDGRIKAFIQSVDSPEFVDADKVLGHLHYSEFLLTPIDGGNNTYMRVEINSDPKGLIPKWMVNMTQKTWPIKFFTGLREQLAAKNQLAH